ncbi:hypothetical protein Salat_2623300 [Sesamum alatum]|uniref:Uncharacterized protein n=1 Tax=Sesamum alatum TaxID=300844 RepID=A0AAE2CAP9_9LAMI|nr:hypothetical protein Salat_2623300 [Sesamum alatum]
MLLFFFLPVFYSSSCNCPLVLLHRLWTKPVAALRADSIVLFVFLSFPASRWLGCCSPASSFTRTALSDPSWLSTWQEERKLRLQPRLLLHPASHNVCSSKQIELAKASSQAFHAFISDLEASPAPIVVGKQPVEPTPDKGNNADVEGAKPTSFAGLFSNNRKLTDDNKLQKFVLGEGTLKLEMNDLINVKAKLGFYLVGYIAGKFPGFKAIRAMAHSWGASFQQHASG